MCKISVGISCDKVCGLVVLLCLYHILPCAIPWDNPGYSQSPEIEKYNSPSIHKTSLIKLILSSLKAAQTYFKIMETIRVLSEITLI